MHLTSHNIIGGVVKYDIEVLIVGAGSGATTMSTGGAGGQVRTIGALVQRGQSYQVIIGAGGAGTPYVSATGNASSFGASSASPGQANGTSGSGRSGGAYASSPGSWAYGGGGGDASAGGNGSAVCGGEYCYGYGGNGGNGSYSAYSGAGAYYGGGAGGRAWGDTDYAEGANGAGGGGSANSGGGGLWTGGSGVVIVRYPGAQRGAGGVVTSAGGFTIHTFTTSGAFVA